jgi:hypothetical protein
VEVMMNSFVVWVKHLNCIVKVMHFPDAPEASVLHARMSALNSLHHHVCLLSEGMNSLSTFLWL